VPNLPFSGIRICDLSYFWAGPYCTAYFGGLGAEVIKIESIQRPDSFRFGALASDLYWEANSQWNCTNVNKYGITLDLGNPKGNQLFKELVKVSDVVIENFAPRVMQNFNLTYEVLKEVKSDIIMMSMPGYGMYGPWRDFVGFGLAFEQSSGLSYLTGYVNGAPQSMGGAADPISGMHAAFVLQAALEYRRRTGKGQLIDVSQTEVLTNFLGAAVIDFSLNERVWKRMGNQDPVMVPHSVYRCKGTDMWVAIAVSSDREWKGFCQVIGKPELIEDERFATLINRWNNQDTLNQIIEKWTVERDRYEVMAMLQKAGIAAGVAVNPAFLNEEPHLQERKFFIEMTRDVVGTQLFNNWPIRFSEMQMTMRPAPTLGEHNNYVLETILGLSKSDIEELEKNKIIGRTPLAMGSFGV